MAGVETTNLEQVDNFFVGKTVPATKYLKFIHKGLSRKVILTYRYIYETFLPKSDYKLSLPFQIEYYGEKYLGPDNENSESEIYIPVE